MPSSESQHFVVLGAGVIGMTTALTLRQTFPSSKITIIAKYLPGDTSIEYTSPWAGANWQSFERDGNSLLSHYDRVTFLKFKEIEKQHPEAGIRSMGVRIAFDGSIEELGMLDADGKVWYEDLVGGVTKVAKEEVPEGLTEAVDIKSTFILNAQVYLVWLQNECLKNNIIFNRRFYSHIDDIPPSFPHPPTALFNCTALGSLTLGGVLDTAVYPTRGQTILIAEPKVPLSRMYVRSSRGNADETTYVFPRPLGGGVILGGSRQEENWSPEVDSDLAGKILERCVRLVPELGGVENVQVIGHRVGLRPSRRGGTRIELEKRGKGIVVHNYGHSGAGYQSSWGSAARAVELLKQELEPSSKL